MGSDIVRDLAVIDDRDEFISSVADAAEAVISQAIAMNGQAHVVLTGGTMGIAVLTGFATGVSARLDWDKVHFWWGDERFVAADSPDRNALQARNAFLNDTGIPEENIHEMPSSDAGLTLDGAAESYCAELASFAQPGDSLPRFDLTFLGIGPDSHVASLFPDHPDACVDGVCVAVRNSPKPPPERVSLTFATLNTSERIWVVACGSDKAEAVAAMWSHHLSLSYPSSCVHGRVQTKIWADSAAATHII